MCRSANVPPNGSELTSWRRRRDDDTTTTRRRHEENNPNTGPTPDPNYKREPFATHSGKTTANTSLQHFTTTLLHNTSLQHFSTQHFSSTLHHYNTSLQHLKKNISPQHCTITHPVLLQYYSSTTNVLLQYYSVLQSTTPVLQSTTLYYKVLLQYYLDRNDVRTTSIQYYSVLQSTTPVLLQYYSVLQSTTPVLLRTTKVLQSTTPYYRVLLQYYSVVQSSTKASKTSISCETSSTFQRTSFQNEYFVRDFRNFSSDKLPKRAFRARLPQLFKEQASKTSISCETSATFQATSFQNEHFVRGFLNFSGNKLPKRAFRARLPQLFNQGASKVLRLPRKTRK